ncbi:hypothetical protein [Streptomyces griseorubiginosus]|uniref:hypothetical protein n=1 Tax=Streptomyces griseorubiginosus TaxID=67304 RepID=UPI002E8187B4|nr:hypothetical protein [Streptomyces griseorubiginosus]WUB46392.1 hypothetical protein OHN19_24880 [Streptomyces griseorubiginosus]WUB54913.1 hypothetical protein OG942_24885 [Streptomyces griseorubiginosus]
MAQGVLRLRIERGVVVIPKPVRPEHMAGNIDVFEFQLAKEEMNRIVTLDTGARNRPGTTPYLDHAVTPACRGLDRSRKTRRLVAFWATAKPSAKTFWRSRP